MNPQIQFIVDNPHFSYETLELKKVITKLEKDVNNKQSELAESKNRLAEFLETGIPPADLNIKQDNPDPVLEQLRSNYRIVDAHDGTKHPFALERKTFKIFGKQFWKHVYWYVSVENARKKIDYLVKLEYAKRNGPTIIY